MFGEKFEMKRGKVEDKKKAYAMKEIKIDGYSQGILELQSDRIMSTPLVNCFYEQPYFIRHQSIRYMRRFRHDFERNALEIWTY